MRYVSPAKMVEPKALPNVGAQFAVTYHVLGGREFGSASGNEFHVPGFDVCPRTLRRPYVDHHASGSVGLLEGKGDAGGGNRRHPGPQEATAVYWLGVLVRSLYGHRALHR